MVVERNCSPMAVPPGPVPLPLRPSVALLKAIIEQHGGEQSRSRRAHRVRRADDGHVDASRANLLRERRR